MSEGSSEYDFEVEEGVLPEDGHITYLNSLKRLIEYQQEHKKPKGLVDRFKNVFSRNTGPVNFNETETELVGIAEHLATVIKTNGTTEEIKIMPNIVTYKHVVRVPQGSGELLIQLNLSNLHHKWSEGTDEYLGVEDYGYAIEIVKAENEHIHRDSHNGFYHPANGFRLLMPLGDLGANPHYQTYEQKGENRPVSIKTSHPASERYGRDVPEIQREYVTLISQAIDAVLENAPKDDVQAAINLTPSSSPAVDYMDMLLKR